MIDMLANMIRTVTDFGLARVFKRYYSVYRAQVTDNADPDRRGRVKLKVPSVFGDEPLPSYAEPRDFRSAGPNRGEFYPPNVDDWVYVEFEEGDPRFPIYSGGWHAEGELSEEFEHEAEVPQTRGYQNKYGHVFKFVESAGKERVYVSTPKGHFFILDDSEGAEATFLIHPSGAQLQIDPDGGVKMVAKDGAYIALDAASGALTVTSKDGSTIAMKDDIVMIPKAGDVALMLKEGVAQMTSAKDLTLAGNAVTLSGGAVTVDASGAKLALGNGKVALGFGPTELVDSVIKMIDSLLNTPSLCTTGVGPSGPLSPPAAVELGLLKTALTAIKGSL